jgi:maltose O-acetyltransferase
MAGPTWFARSDHGPNAPAIAGTANLGEDALIDCQARVTIGAYAFFGHRVMILTGTHDLYAFGKNRQHQHGARPVTIGEGVWVCSGAIICPGVTVGAHAVIGPGAVVLRNVPPYALVAGNPARLVRYLASRETRRAYRAQRRQVTV